MEQVVSVGARVEGTGVDAVLQVDTSVDQAGVCWWGGVGWGGVGVKGMWGRDERRVRIDD